MKPAPFDYHAPGTLEEALELLARYGDDAKVIAGGQSLVPLLAFRFAQPAVLVDLNRVAGHRSIDVGSGGELVVGALARTRAAELSDVVARTAPLVGAAIPHIGHPQIRNRGTVGGSIAHADPTAELPVTMVAAGATLVARSVRGEREIRAADFFRTFFTTALEPDEVLTTVRVPRHGGGVAFMEVSRRHGDFALIDVAARVELDADGRCRDVHVAVGGAADRPLDVTEQCRPAVGARLDEPLARELGAAVVGAIDPTGDVHASAEYRRHVAGVLVRRALLQAQDRATEVAA